MKDASAPPLQPVQGPFMLPRSIGPALLGLVLGGVLFGGLLAGGLGLAVAAAGGAGLAVAIVALGLYAALVAFRKERYELGATRLICHHGGLLSDESTELDIRNITHVKVRLPWIRHKFFGVGDVFVESAGSGGSEIALRSIRDPERVYDEIQQRMQRNGYSLQRGQLLHEEQPDFLGVVIECLGMAAGVIVGLVWFTAGLILDEGVDPDQAVQAANSQLGAGAVTMVVAGIGGLVLLGGAFGLIVHYLDLRRRTYRVFDDVVVYEEGFLTRDNALIPFENIADANTKRTLIDQILGLYDVQVSCQGSGSEIKFRRLRRGDALTDAVGRLVDAARQRPSPSSERVSPVVGAALGLPEPPPGVELVPPEQAWTARLQPDLVRAVVGTFPHGFLIIPAVKALIDALVTSYQVRGSSVQSAYRFLTSHEREFAYDKVTGVVVNTSPWDRVFNTCTVRFWSIGAAMPLDLAHVKRDQLDLRALLRQAGIPAASAEPYEAQTRFGLGAWVRGRLPTAIAYALAAAALLVLGATAGKGGVAFFALLVPLALLLVVWLAYLHVYYGRQRLRFHPGHAEAETGVLWRSHYYARYDNIKKVQVTRYPGCDLGSVQLFVAGEMRVAPNQKPGQEAQQSGGAVIPYSFSASFLDGIADKQHLIDDFLLGRVRPTPGARSAAPLQLLREARPALGNGLFKLILLSLFAVPLLPLLPLTLPWAILAIRRRSYLVEAGRVVSLRGIVYRRQTSVLFTRIDSLRQGQGALGKLFKNGTVTLLTAGSSSPDLVLTDLPEFKAFYEEIRPHYGRHD